MRPRDAKTSEDIRKLRSDNKDVPEGWIRINGDTVMVYQQRCGEESTGKVNLPRAEFNRLIDWYNREQKPL